MEFVKEIRRAETTNTIEKEIVWYENKLSEMITRLNATDKDMRLMVVGAILHQLLSCTQMKTLERLGLLETTKGLCQL